MGSGGITPPFSTPALDGSEWSASRPGGLTLWEEPTGRPESCSGRCEQNYLLTLAENGTLAVQPAACRCTDWGDATLASTVPRRSQVYPGCRVGPHTVAWPTGDFTRHAAPATPVNSHGDGGVSPRALWCGLGPPCRDQDLGPQSFVCWVSSWEASEPPASVLHFCRGGAGWGGVGWGGSHPTKYNLLYVFIRTLVDHDHIMAYLLKARIVKPAEITVTEQRLRKQACFRGNWIKQQWEAVFSTRSEPRCNK
jgi:hypothetical protein